MLYVVYDVTSMLLSGATSEEEGEQASGKHAIGVELANGWWNPLPLQFWGHDNLREGLMTLQNRSSSEPMFKLRVVGTTADGTEHELISSSAKDSTTYTWKAGGSPTIFNNIYLGEKYDARMEAACVLRGIITPSESFNLPLFWGRPTSMTRAFPGVDTQTGQRWAMMTPSGPSRLKQTRHRSEDWWRSRPLRSGGRVC